MAVFPANSTFVSSPSSSFPPSPPPATYDIIFTDKKGGGGSRGDGWEGRDGRDADVFRLNTDSDDEERDF